MLPSILGAETYPTDWPRRPTGLMADDQPLWTRWRAKHATAYAGWAFNVRLPTARDLTLPNDPAARAFLDSLARRIDVLALTHDNRVDILELSTSPSPSALGQLAIYRALWRQHGPLPLRWLLLVAAFVVPELVLAAADLEITIELA